MPSFRGSFQPKDWTLISHVSCISRFCCCCCCCFSTTSDAWEAPEEAWLNPQQQAPLLGLAECSWRFPSTALSRLALWPHATSPQSHTSMHSFTLHLLNSSYAPGIVQIPEHIRYTEYAQLPHGACFLRRTTAEDDKCSEEITGRARRLGSSCLSPPSHRRQGPRPRASRETRGSLFSPTDWGQGAIVVSLGQFGRENWDKLDTL